MLFKALIFGTGRDLKRLHQAANGHLKVQPPLHADGCVRADAGVPCRFALQDALVENRYNRHKS
jgi:hypothetical protein